MTLDLAAALSDDARQSIVGCGLGALRVLEELRGINARITWVTRDLRHAENARRLARSSQADVVVAEGLSAALQPADATIIDLREMPSSTQLHLWLFEAAQVLGATGILYVITANRRARFVRAAVTRSFGVPTLRQKSATLSLLSAHQNVLANVAPTPESFSVEAQIFGRLFHFESTSGLFSAKRIDAGSLALLDRVLREAPTQSVSRILDLGCGYGLLGAVLASTFRQATVDLIDVDVAAVRCAAGSLIRSSVANASAQLADARMDLPTNEFDLIVSHLPLHIPQSELIELLLGAHRALRPNGSIWTVSLRTYSLSRVIGSIFPGANRTTVAGPDGSYEIVQVARTDS